jgi:hypothetical protein
MSTLLWEMLYDLDCYNDFNYDILRDFYISSHRVLSRPSGQGVYFMMRLIMNHLSEGARRSRLNELG